MPRAWLERIGCTADDLECGAHLPYHQGAAEVLLRSGAAPTTLHNNCSGKHAGFLTVARHLGHPTAGYIRYDHPVQQQILGILETLTGLDLSDAPRGIDGCGIPVLGIPLGNLALAIKLKDGTTKTITAYSNRRRQVQAVHKTAAEFLGQR